MRFVIATHHFAGLGFAMRLLEEGHDVVMAFSGIDDRRANAAYDKLGDGFASDSSAS